MDRRQLPEDFKEFINFLNGNDVCYLLVGGWTVRLLTMCPVWQGAVEQIPTIVRI